MIKKLKLKLIQSLIYGWDVVFTWIDATQLRIWVRLKSIEQQLIANQQVLTKPKITDEQIQQEWDDLLKNARFEGKISIRKCAGRINNGN